MCRMGPNAEFDEFAETYEKNLERPCALSGETPDFYAEGRLRWCRERFGSRLPFETVLDFGCGIGGSFRHFFELVGCKSVIGIDPSSRSLQVARDRYSEYDIRLSAPENFVPNGDLPFAFSNGVFHHIPPAGRLEALALVRAALAADGLFAFWENNPWNPVVAHGMTLNEFDRDAQMISPRAAVRLLKSAGFRISFVDFCFFFPRFARSLRGTERYLRKFPLGAQYLIAAQK